MATSRCLLTAWMVASSLGGRAAPEAAGSESEPSPAPSAAPVPGQASGVAVPARPGAKRWLWIPRVVFYVPSRIVSVAMTPVRFALDAYDRYELRRVFYRVFFTRRRGLGVYPLARLQSGFGGSVGARVAHDDLFSAGGRLRLQGSLGTRYGQRLDGSLDTGDLMSGGVTLGVSGQYRIIPSDVFYGYGDDAFDGAFPGA